MSFFSTIWALPAKDLNDINLTNLANVSQALLNELQKLNDNTYNISDPFPNNYSEETVVTEITVRPPFVNDQTRCAVLYSSISRYKTAATALQSIANSSVSFPNDFNKIYNEGLTARADVLTAFNSMACNPTPSSFSINAPTIKNQPNATCTQLVTAYKNAWLVTGYNLPNWLQFIPGMKCVIDGQPVDCSQTGARHIDAQRFADDLLSAATSYGCIL